MDLKARGVTNNDNFRNKRNCLCDEQCHEYGDCCTDLKSFDPVAQQRAAGWHECVATDGGDGAYVTAKCPAEWRDTTVRAACESPPQSREAPGVLDNPVTGRSTGRSYRNRFCAVCNGDADNPRVWDTRMVCEDLADVEAAAEQAVLDTLRYESGNHWTVRYRGREFGCATAVVPPVGSRACLPGMVVACHPMWPDDDMRSNCDAYTTVVYNGQLPYKNIHCAMCNHVPVQNLTCDTVELHNRFNVNQFAARSFTALFVAQPGHRKCSGADMYYDPLAKMCRPLATTASCSESDNGTVAACPGNRSIAVPAAEALWSVTLTYVGLSVSVVFLVTHLLVFALVPEMKNLSGKNLASFCVSLVFSYSAFVASNWLTGPACYAGAAVTYYSFLASFAWMLVMSFDCWRSLRLATVELRITTGRQTKKFVVYSAVCWLVPAMMTFVAVAADAVPAVPADVRPRFGADQCWFGSKTALLVFFAGPLAFVMTVNVALFAHTARMIHVSRATVRHVNTRHTRRDFRMYCRLAVLMGLTWTTGVLASYADNKYLWIVFVALNTFQGLFVFVAFTCRRRVYDTLVGGCCRGRQHSDLEKDTKGPRAPPPSFSWSLPDNSTSTTPVSSEKTSETLY